MEEEIWAILGSSILPFIFVFGVISSIARSIKKAFESEKSPFAHFKFEGQMPDDLTRIFNFKLGNKASYSNLVKMGERDQTLYIKLPFKMGFAVPLRSLKSVSIEDKGEIWKIMSITFSEAQPLPIKFWLKQNQWAQFPELMKMAKQEVKPSQTKKKPLPIFNDPASAPPEQTKAFQAHLIRVFIIFVATSVVIAYLTAA